MAGLKQIMEIFKAINQPLSSEQRVRWYIQRKDGKGMERKRQIKDGHIVVKNPLYQEMPKQEVAIKSGRTLYRFTGSYDGERSLPHKVLRLM